MLRSLRVIAVCLLLVPLGAHGQAPAAAAPPAATDPGLFIGFRAGYSNYTLSGTEAGLRAQPGADKVVSVPFVTAGGIVRQRIYEPLSVQGELLYVRQGGDFTRRVFPGKTNYAIDCLQVPLLLDVRLGGANGPSLHLQGGLAFVLVVNGVELDAFSFAPGNQFNNPAAMWAQVYGAELAWARDGRVYTLGARATKDQEDFYQREYNGTHYNARSSGFSLTAGMLFAR